MIAVYGAGNVGIGNVQFLQYLNYDIKDIVFCDGDEKKHNTYIQDICVLNFDEVKKIENVVFVISVVPNSEAYKEIELTLKNNNVEYYENITSFLEIKEKKDKTFVHRMFCAFFHVEAMDGYFDSAENTLDTFWGDNTPFYKMFKKMDVSNVIELACGRGRHVQKYYDKAQNITLVDILDKNIEFCKSRFKDKTNIKYYVNAGNDFKELESEKYTALFTYDAMVHFELLDVNDYLRETYRVLKKGGMALFHHSNLMLNYKQSFDNASNPGGRNFMSKELFAYLAYHAGFEIIEQQVIDWSLKEMDCITLVKKI